MERFGLAYWLERIISLYFDDHYGEGRWYRSGPATVTGQKSLPLRHSP
jgi:hypothetical protein